MRCVAAGRQRRHPDERRPPDAVACGGRQRSRARATSTVEIVVVANGVAVGTISDCRATIGSGSLSCAENLGIPGGRNLGSHAGRRSPARLPRRRRPIRPTADVLARCVGAFATTPRSASLALRIVDENGDTARRHVPRLGSPACRSQRAGRPPSSVVPSSSAAPRSSEVGGYASRLPVRDGGDRSRPAPRRRRLDDPLRRARRPWSTRGPIRRGIPAPLERTMRNRVWLAYRNLPAPLAVVYVANWFVISALRQPASAAGDLVRTESATAGGPGPAVNGSRSAGAPSPASPGSADRRSCETGSVPTMTGRPTATTPPLAADERAALIAAHERRVEALRNSAQYRVGELVIASARSPRRLVRLPVDLWRLRKELLARYRVAPLAPATIGAAGPRRRRRHDPRRVLAPGVRPGVGPTSHLGGRRPRRPARRPSVRRCCSSSRRGRQRRSVPLRLAHFAKRRSPFRDVSRLRQAGIPTVFWNKEDPVHFDDVRRRAQPSSTGSSRPTPTASIATSRLAGHRSRRRPPVRRPATRCTTRSAHPSRAWPGRASPGAGRPTLADRVPTSRCCCVRPRRRSARHLRPHGDPVRPVPVPDRTPGGARRADYATADDYRRYACFLNVNSVKTSPTMCSRRVFELLACRTPVVSTPSRAIDELLGDAVITVETQADARARRRAAGRRSRAPRSCRPARLPRRDVAAHLRPSRRQILSTTRHRLTVRRRRGSPCWRRPTGPSSSTACSTTSPGSATSTPSSSC